MECQHAYMFDGVDDEILIQFRRSRVGISAFTGTNHPKWRVQQPISFGGNGPASALIMSNYWSAETEGLVTVLHFMGMQHSSAKEVRFSVQPVGITPLWLFLKTLGVWQMCDFISREVG